MINSLVQLFLTMYIIDIWEFAGNSLKVSILCEVSVWKIRVNEKQIVNEVSSILNTKEHTFHSPNSWNNLSLFFHLYTRIVKFIYTNVERIFPIILHISTFSAPTSLSYCSALSWSGSTDTFTLSHQILSGVQSLCHRRYEQWHLIVFWCSYPCKEKDTCAKFTATWRWRTGSTG